MATEFSPPSIASLKDFELITKGNEFLTWRAFSSELGKKVEILYAKPDANPVYINHAVYIASLFLKMNHPSLAEVYEVGKDGNNPFIIQEIPEGQSLAEIVNKNGPLTDKDAISFALQIAEALAYVTSQSNIVIRNLKPQNIFLNSDGVAKITDFRYAIIALDPQHGPVIDGDNIIGTPYYISPEQAEGSPLVDPRADMYALGTILYYLLLNRAPFDGMDSLDIIESQQNAQIANPREINPHISTEITALITKLLVKSPQMRYQSWGDVVNEIKNVGKGKKCTRLQPGAISTIAPLPGETQFADIAPEVFGKKSDIKAKTESKQAAPANAPTNPFAEAKKSGHGWKFLLWFILILWFVFLANCRMKNPLHLPEACAPEFSIPFLDNLTDKMLGKSQQTEVLSAVEEQAQSPKSEAERKPEPEEPTVSDKSPEPTPHSGQEITQAEMESILAKLKDADIRGAATTARAFAKTPKGREIYDCLEKTPDIDKTLGNVLMDMRGKSITINYKGKDRKVVPDKLINDELTVKGTRTDGATFDLVLKISQFQDQEKLSLISAYATSEMHHIVAASLALKLGDTECFKRHAGNSGPLAPVFSLVQ